MAIVGHWMNAMLQRIIRDEKNVVQHRSDLFVVSLVLAVRCWAVVHVSH